MHEIVKAFIEAKKAENQKNYEKKKAETLTALDLYEKEYSPFDHYTAEYPDSEYVGKNENDENKFKYYRKKPIEISDEEYEEVLKYTKLSLSTKKNSAAQALSVIAWILFIGGFIAGFVLGTSEVDKEYYYTDTETVFSFATALTCWVATFVSGTLFLGFAEILQLLEEIRDNTRGK